MNLISSDALKRQLSSTNHLEVAHALGDIAINEIRTQPELGGPIVADALKKLFEEIWKPIPTVETGSEKKSQTFNAHAASEDKQKRAELFKNVLTTLTTNEQKRHLAHAYARMGHLYEIGGLLTRENYMNSLRNRTGELSKTKLGGVPEFVAEMPDAKTAVQRLNEPVFEIEMTQHPTNTNSLLSIKAQRRMGIAAERIVMDDFQDERGIDGLVDDLKKEVRLYFNDEITPLLHRELNPDGTAKKDGADINFTVLDETAIVINQLENIYDDLPRAYGQCDDALRAKSTLPNEYNPLDLKLNLRFGSWGSSGDKDGNWSVTCETTLMAAGMHKLAILKKYDESLTSLEKHTHHGDTFKKWHDEIKRNITILNKELGDMRSEMAINFPHLTPEQFTRHLDNIAAAIPAPKPHGRVKNLEEAKRAFLSDLEETYNRQDIGSDVKEETLSLIRRVRQFGFTLAKIEYRETAKEYTTVASTLLGTDYSKLGDDGRMGYLEDILSSSRKYQQVLKPATWSFIARDGSAKPYLNDKKEVDPTVITYHTLQRMRIAANFPEMIQDNVLAECTKPQNLLEAKLMQHAIYTIEDRKERATLGIVPLFEDPKTMEKVDQIVKKAYESPAYRQHLKDIAEARFELFNEKVPLTQQVQIAHSDNARRSGLLAARGYIHRAHKVLRSMTEQWNKHNPTEAISLQFFEGGSVSDAYRNGVRAISESIDAFELFDFAKFTFQGGDIINYFNQPCSSTRLLTRAAAHSARRKFDLEQSGNGKERGAKRNNVADDVAIRALTRTLNDYEAHDFNEDYNKMGVLLAALDYDGEVTAGNRGSRAAARGGVAFGKAASVALGAVIKPIEVDKVRTISFSEAWQHNGVVPSWIGSDKLEEYLKESIRNEVIFVTQNKDGTAAEKKAVADGTLSPDTFARLQEDRKKFLADFGDIVDTGVVLPRHIMSLYDQSPAFRDAQDRSAYGVALSDMDALDQLNMTFTKQPGDGEDVKGWKDMGHEYLDRIRNTYRRAGVMAEAAMAKREATPNWSFSERYGDKKDAESSFSPLRMSVTGALDRMTDQIIIKDAYRDFILQFKKSLNESRPVPKAQGASGPDDKRSHDEYWHMRGVLHNAGDTVVHGRVLPADDIFYGRQLQLDKNPKEPVRGEAVPAL